MMLSLQVVALASHNKCRYILYLYDHILYNQVQKIGIKRIMSRTTRKLTASVDRKSL